MSVTRLLFDLGRRPPTTRQVADLVRAGGRAALTEAERRADAARYQEVLCRSALNRVQGMPFEWTLNPYRGCTHGCHYCYARRYQTQFELDADDDFASIVFVKTNLVDVLRRELARPSWARAYVALGTATDCYQPIEGHHRLTRGALEALRDFGNPVGIVTKGPMVVRDKDVLADLTAGPGCSVYVSVPTRTRGGSSNRAPRRRSSACARCASSSTPASARACSWPRLFPVSPPSRRSSSVR
jgi:hypothetical protein